jgi:hypothetical protein
MGHLERTLCPKPKTNPLPEYCMEFRFVAPMASATAATPLRCPHPATNVTTAIPINNTEQIRIIGSLRKNVDWWLDYARLRGSIQANDV